MACPGPCPCCVAGATPFHHGASYGNCSVSAQLRTSGPTTHDIPFRAICKPACPRIDVRNTAASACCSAGLARLTARGWWQSIATYVPLRQLPSVRPSKETVMILELQKELLLCPFCGQSATMFQLPESDVPAHFSHSLYWAVGCATEDCPCHYAWTHQGWQRKRDALRSWNMRSDSSVAPHNTL